MKHVDATANRDVQLQDLEVIFLEGKLCQANRLILNYEIFRYSLL